MTTLISVIGLLWGLNFGETNFKVHWPPLYSITAGCMCGWISNISLSVLGGDNQLLEEDLYSDDDNEEGSASIYEVQPAASPKSQLSSSAMHRPFLHFSSWVHGEKKKVLKSCPPGDKFAMCMKVNVFKVHSLATKGQELVASFIFKHGAGFECWHRTSATSGHQSVTVFNSHLIRYLVNRFSLWRETSHLKHTWLFFILYRLS